MPQRLLPKQKQKQKLKPRRRQMLPSVLQRQRKLQNLRFRQKPKQKRSKRRKTSQRRSKTRPKTRINTRIYTRINTRTDRSKICSKHLQTSSEFATFATKYFSLWECWSFIELVFGSRCWESIKRNLPRRHPVHQSIRVDSVDCLNTHRSSLAALCSSRRSSDWELCRISRHRLYFSCSAGHLETCIRLPGTSTNGA